MSRTLLEKGGGEVWIDRTYISKDFSRSLFSPAAILDDNRHMKLY
jgi:hypothetical protein